MKIINTDILVLGLGSAGFSAVYCALQGGTSVVGVEQMPGPGGTSTFGGVNNWEPGVSFDGIHQEIAQRLLERGEAFVGKAAEYVTSANRFATSDRSDDPYESTLKCFGVHPDDMRRLHYEPDAMSAVMQELMEEADSNGRLTLYYNSKFVSLDTHSRQIRSCVIETPEGLVTVCPKLVIDSTADILPSRMAGCAWAIGEDARETYGEKAAPEKASRSLNGLTQCFRITNTGTEIPSVPPQYDDVDLSDWVEFMNRTMGPVSCFNVYPRGGIYVNMLPTGEGDMYLHYPMPVLKHICEARAYRYMQWLAEKGYLNGWEITHMFPLLGLRETYRLVGQYVLTIDDICRGYAPSLGDAHTIAIADHGADIHGRDNRGDETHPGYGIPYECLLPKEIDNLLVACRGSSFTHLAASSTRLSRTMLQLGEAAGTAAAVCIKTGCTPKDVDVSLLRKMRGIE